MQTQKASKKKKDTLFHSLSARIILLALILLVLPLFFHNIFMFWEDYQDKKDNLFLDLKIVGDNKSYDVLQYIESEQKFLSWISSQEITKELLLRAQHEEKLSTLSFLSAEGENLVFSKSLYLQNNPDIESDLKLYDSFLFEENSEKTLVVTVSVKQDGQFKGYLVSETPINNLKKELFQQFTFPYPVEISFHETDFDPFPKTPGNETFSAKVHNEDVFVKRVPFAKSNFSLFFVVEQKEVSDLSMTRLLWRGLSLVSFFLIFGGLFLFIFVRRMYKPMKHLLDVIDKIFYYDLEARYVPDKMGFEINVLGEHFNKMIDSVFHYQQEAQTIKVQQEALKKELEIGNDIQQSLFPKNIPSLTSIDIEGRCFPAKEVGGDFFDIYLLEDKLVFCVADAAGKGVSACLYSLGIRSLLRSALSQEKDLTKALKTVNTLFHEDVGDIGVFTTLWIGIIDTKTFELTYSSLGHHPLLLKRGLELQELNTQSNALGPFEDVFIEMKTVVLQSNDQLLLFTDGVVDCQNTKKEFFGYENIKKYFQSHRNVHAKALVDNFLAHLREFSGEEPLFDDLTLLSLFLKK